MAELLSGRYRLGPLLGGGGMADVYAAVDERLHRDVAVKLFRGHGDERQASEVQVLAALNHPNLVQIYDADLGRPAYVVMELVEGRSLDVLLREGGHIDVTAVGAGVAAGLAYAHARGVVHRDVKPGNVIVARDGRVKLADFGIARLVDQAHLTQTGQLMGTAAYLAPEQARGEGVTGAADVYALGLVLLECTTGRREYDGAATEAAVARLSRPPRIPADAPHAALLRAMTATDPAARPSAAAVAARLSGAEPPTVALSRPTPTPTPTPTPMPTQVLPTVVDPQPRRRTGSAWPWITAVGLLLAAGIAAIVLYAVHEGTADDRTTVPTQNSSTEAPSITPTTASSVTPTTSSAAPTTTSATPSTSSPSASASSSPSTSPSSAPTASATDSSAAPTTSSAGTTTPGVGLSLPAAVGATTGGANP